jgi:hypothetical protein
LPKLTPKFLGSARSVILQDYAQQGFVDLQPAELGSICDESLLFEFAHEISYAGARGTDHLPQDIVGYCGDRSWWLALLPIASEQQKRACQSLLSVVEELIDQIPFDSNLSCKQKSEEPIGKLGSRVEHASHLVFVYNEHGSRC